MVERGVARFEGACPADRVVAARRMVTELAVEHGVSSNGEWAVAASRFGYPKPLRNAFNGLVRSASFPDLVGQGFAPFVAGLIGEAVMPMMPGQQILFTLPGEEPWCIPHDVWHVDMPRFGDGASPGLQAFVLLEDIDHQGGATLVVAGSHHLFNRSGILASKELKRRMRVHAYFKALFDPARPAWTDLAQARGYADDVNLEVVELSGKAGDVFLMDLRLLHTPAPNASSEARMMLTCRFPRAEIAARMGSAAMLSQTM